MSAPVAAVRIGFIGGGAMGEALAAGVLAAGVPAERVRAADPDPARRKQLEQALGIEAGDDNAGLVAASDLVVLAVKPALVVPALTALGGAAAPALARPLWISIAAGVPLTALRAALPPAARVIRAMPNTPALVRCGATAFVAGAGCGASERTLARALFEAVGMAWEAPAETLLDAVTGLSGSGPAYVAVMIEALADGGVRMGLPRDLATILATQTVLGSAKMLLETGLHPSQLKDMVASPAGTTIAGLHALERGGLRGALMDAVEAATNRSTELGR